MCEEMSPFLLSFAVISFQPFLSGLPRLVHSAQWQGRRRLQRPARYIKQVVGSTFTHHFPCPTLSYCNTGTTRFFSFPMSPTDRIEELIRPRWKKVLSPGPSPATADTWNGPFIITKITTNQNNSGEQQCMDIWRARAPDITLSSTMKSEPRKRTIELPINLSIRLSAHNLETPYFISPKAAIDQLENAWSAEITDSTAEGFIQFHPDDDEWINGAKTEAEHWLDGHASHAEMKQLEKQGYALYDCEGHPFTTSIKGWVSIPGTADARKDSSDRIELELKMSPDFWIEPKTQASTVINSDPSQGTSPKDVNPSMPPGWSGWSWETPSQSRSETVPSPVRSQG